MDAERSRKQIARINKARIKGVRYVVRKAKYGKAKLARFKYGKTKSARDKSGGFVISGNAGQPVRSSRAYAGSAPAAEVTNALPEQPRPKIPLLTGGKDPTLAERFEEELYRS